MNYKKFLILALAALFVALSLSVAHAAPTVQNCFGGSTIPDGMYCYQMGFSGVYQTDGTTGSSSVSCSVNVPMDVVECSGQLGPTGDAVFMNPDLAWLSDSSCQNVAITGMMDSLTYQRDFDYFNLTDVGQLRATETFLIFEQDQDFSSVTGDYDHVMPIMGSIASMFYRFSIWQQSDPAHLLINDFSMQFSLMDMISLVDCSAGVPTPMPTQPPTSTPSIMVLPSGRVIVPEEHFTMADYAIIALLGMILLISVFRLIRDIAKGIEAR